MPSANVSWPPPLTRLTPFHPGQPGVPGTDSDRGLRLDSNGIILWVDPNHVDANDNRDGTNPESPLRTVSAALSHCRAYRGDVIAVMGNSFWDYGNTAVGRATPIREEVTVTVPGVRIVGVSPGALGVYWEPASNNGVCITVNAIDVTIEGFCFWNDTYTGGTGIFAQWNSGTSYYGENLIVRHCSFMADLDYGIVLDYTYFVHIEDCQFYAIGDTGIDNTSVQGDPDYSTVRRNLFWECVTGVDFNSVVSTTIEENRFLYCATGIIINGGAYNSVQSNKIIINQTGVCAISMTGSQGNIVHDNVIQGAGGGTNNFINATGGGLNMVSGNYLDCSIAQYDVTCSDATSGSWVFNHCWDGDPVLPPI